jgi:DNA glycosylase AlkZ-like
VPDPVLSTRVLNRTLLGRQLLLARVDRPVMEVVEHLVGLQAQVPTAPYLGLWSRIAGFTPADLSTEILERRAVRMALMRSTIHLVSTDDAVALRPVMQPVLDRELFGNRTWSVGLAGVDLAPVLALGRAMVEERPRTLAEIRVAMAGRWPEHDAATLAYAVRNLLPTIQVPPRGVWGRAGAPRLTTIGAWAGRPASAETSPDATILRYLAAFGPAATADVQAWSRLNGLRDAVERLRPRLRTFRDERGRELLDVPDWLLADADVPAPVRFLPEYDNVLLGHADRRRVIPEPFASLVRGRIGRPSFLVDGFLAGFWRLERAARADPAAGATLVVEPLLPLGPGDRSAVEAEAAALLSLLVPGAPGRVTFADPG